MRKKGSGGSRPGAGRKPMAEGEKAVGVTVYISPIAAQRLKELRKVDKSINLRIRDYFDFITG